LLHGCGNAGEGGTPEIAGGESKSHLRLAVPGEGRESPNSPAIGEVRKSSYHPSQQGSWSIKQLLPAITDMDYETLSGVKDGGMAMEAYIEAIATGASLDRKDAIGRELRDYCALDTEAMMRIWQYFRGAPFDIGTP
jgi:hypothetical protein